MNDSERWKESIIQANCKKLHYETGQQEIAKHRCAQVSCKHEIVFEIECHDPGPCGMPTGHEFLFSVFLSNYFIFETRHFFSNYP